MLHLFLYREEIKHITHINKYIKSNREGKGDKGNEASTDRGSIVTLCKA